MSDERRADDETDLRERQQRRDRGSLVAALFVSRRI